MINILSIGSALLVVLIQEQYHAGAGKYGIFHAAGTIATLIVGLSAGKLLKNNIDNSDNSDAGLYGIVQQGGKSVCESESGWKGWSHPHSYFPDNWDDDDPIFKVAASAVFVAYNSFCRYLQSHVLDTSFSESPVAWTITDLTLKAECAFNKDIVE